MISLLEKKKYEKTIEKLCQELVETKQKLEECKRRGNLCTCRFIPGLNFDQHSSDYFLKSIGMNK